MKILRGERQHAEAEHTDGLTLSRRRVLGGLAALPAIPALCGTWAS
jgi:hypothetical protein